MPHVPPGNITGVYYIVVAGLPWGCSWQRLKDFARNQQPDGKCIEIDHAMVYPDSTDGWVRVKGKENFRKAFEHLNGGILDDRSLLADGRNETETQTLRDLNTTRTLMLPRRDHNSSSASCNAYSPSASASPYTQTSPSTYSTSEIDWYYQLQQGGPSYHPVSPVCPNGSYYQTPAMYETAASPIFAPPALQYSMGPAAPAMLYGGNIAPALPGYLPQQPVYTYVAPYVDYPIPLPNVSTPGQTPPTNSKNESRKIIISQLPHTITSSDLRDLLAKAADKCGSASSTSRSSSPIHDIEIAKHGDGKAKGSASVVLESRHLARAFVKVVDGMKYQGRVLSARLAKEGAEPGRQSSPPGKLYMPSGSSSSSHYSGNKQRVSKDARSERRPSYDTPSGESGVGETESHRESRYGSGEKKSGAKSGEQARRRSSDVMSTPAVVDGSSSRGSQGMERRSRS